MRNRSRDEENRALAQNKFSARVQPVTLGGKRL